MKIIRATAHWHIRKAQRARKDGRMEDRERHLGIADRLFAQINQSKV